MEPAYGPGGLGSVHLSPHFLGLRAVGRRGPGKDLVGLLPEALRGCCSAVHGGEERPVKLEWRKLR